MKRYMIIGIILGILLMTGVFVWKKAWETKRYQTELKKFLESEKEISEKFKQLQKASMSFEVDKTDPEVKKLMAEEAKRKGLGKE